MARDDTAMFGELILWTLALALIPLLGGLLDVSRREQAAAVVQAQRDLDWASYGEEMRQLGELLERLGPAGSGQQR